MQSVLLETTDQGVAVRLVGEITLAEAAALKAILVEALDARSAVIDCTNLEAVDVAVLQLLLAAKRVAQKRGTTFQFSDSPQSTLASYSAAAGLPAPDDWK